MKSEALWRLYCKPPCKGVALRTTLAKLEKSVAPHDLYISPIKYRPYHEGPGFDDDLDPFMHKRQGFSAENEVRLLKVDDAHFGALMGNRRRPRPSYRHTCIWTGQRPTPSRRSF